MAEIPTGYLTWLLTRCERLDCWARQEVEQELSQRGGRCVPAEAVLRDLEETLSELLSENPFLQHEVAGELGDMLLEAFERVRQRWKIDGRTTALIEPSERRPAGRLEVNW